MHVRSLELWQQLNSKSKELIKICNFNKNIKKISSKTQGQWKIIKTGEHIWAEIGSLHQLFIAEVFPVSLRIWTTLVLHTTKSTKGATRETEQQFH